MSYELQNFKENFTMEEQFPSKPVFYSSPELFQDNDLSFSYEFCMFFTMTQAQLSYICPVVPILS